MPQYCVTGGTGFIAGYLIKALLEKGHDVRATTRNRENKDKVDFLWNLEGAKERLKLFKADLLDDGSFDQAFDGVDGVFHTASPVLIRDDDDVQTKLLDPSLKGTRNVLNSCIKAKSVKRIVLTSSSSAIRLGNHKKPVTTVNESDWSDAEFCKQHKLWYAYSKLLAEQEAWKIAKEGDLDLVVVNPAMTIGPLLASQPSSTLLLTLNIIKGISPVHSNSALGFVHVEDVAAAHILAMEESKAAGRLICSGSLATWWEIIDMLRAKYPMYPYALKCGDQQNDPNVQILDTSKIIQLGFPGFKSIPEMFDDVVQSFQQKGLL